MKPIAIVTFGLTLLLAQCWPKPEPTPTPPPTPTPTTSVKIIQPMGDSKVEQTEMVRGTSQMIPNGHVVWIVVFVHKVGSYYPQNSPAVMESSGNWSSITYIGEPKDIGLKFDLIAVLADQGVQQKFNAYLVQARDKRGFPGLANLPAEATIYNRISVTRK